MSTTATVTQTVSTLVDSTYSLSLNARATSAPLPPTELKQGPVFQTGALNATEYPRILLTPSIGVQFDSSLQLKDVLALKDTAKRDALFKDLAHEGESCHL